MEHHIKCNKITFEETLKGSKPFEIRRNDRYYQKFDNVIMSEFDADKNKYTGRKLSFEIGFVTNYAQRDDYVVFSCLDIKILNSEKEEEEE